MNARSITTSRMRAAVVAACATGILAASAGPAVAQAPTPPAQDQCTEETLHPEYQGQGLCEQPAEGEQPAPPTGQPTPPAGPTPPAQDQCTEETLHPEYQGQGLCDEPADEPAPAPQPRASAGLGGLLGGLFGK